MGWLGRRIKEGGIAVSNRYAQSPVYFDLTPAGRTLIRTLGPLIDRYMEGRVLDAGAGRLSYAQRLRSKATNLVSMDRYRICDRLSVVGDLQKLPFEEGSFDSVFCSQVLEHVPDPLKVLEGFFNVLRPGGTLLVSVPHLAYLHNEPHDYFRYTEFGLTNLLERARFQCVEQRWSGGLLSFLGHLPSTLAINLMWGIPILFPLVVTLNRIWSRGIAALESADQKPRRFALNIVVVARKPQPRQETAERS